MDTYSKIHLIFPLTGVCGSRSIGSVKLDDVTLFCVELLSLKLSGKSSNSNAATTKKNQDQDTKQ